VPAGGNAYPVVAVAHAPSGSTFDLSMNVPTGGVALTGGTATGSAQSAPATASVGGSVPDLTAR
jgi:hypothetical protein